MFIQFVSQHSLHSECNVFLILGYANFNFILKQHIYFCNQLNTPITPPLTKKVQNLDNTLVSFKTTPRLLYNNTTLGATKIRQQLSLCQKSMVALRLRPSLESVVCPLWATVETRWCIIVDSMEQDPSLFRYEELSLSPGEYSYDYYIQLLLDRYL